MRSINEETSCRRGNQQAIDLVSFVKDLHRLSSQELNKLIRESENNTIQWTTKEGSARQIDLEKLARYFALHLLAKLMSFERDEELFRHLLSGTRLLHSLCDLASRHSKLEQVLLDDVKVSEQLLDLIFYMLTVLGVRQEFHASNQMVVLHSASVACSLYLLTVSITPQWNELAQVLLAHPKAEIFMSAAFAALRVDIHFLQMKLPAQHTGTGTKTTHVEETLNLLCQHCEASLQFLQSLCQLKAFRERLVKNKELCGEGGVLLLAQDIMKLHISPSFGESYLVAAVSRLKSKVLSLLLLLCEAESVSYLDEVASTPRSLNVAKSIALEVLELIKTMSRGDFKELSSSLGRTYPRGLLQLNAMRLTDILSDDSNFRSYITIYFTEVLMTIFSLPHGEFLSNWCSSELPVWEEDATLDYDSLAASGRVLDVFSSPEVLYTRNTEPTFNPCHVPRASYAHQRTSLLVKIIANLHCFVPDLCKEEKDLFLSKFLQCLQKELPKLRDGVSLAGSAERPAIISRNLRSLLSHAQSLIPGFLNEDDVQLLRVFISQLEPLLVPPESIISRVQDIKFEESASWERLLKLNIGDHHQEAQSKGGCSSNITRKLSPDVYERSGNLNEGMSENSAVEEVNQFDFNNVLNQSNGVAREDERRDAANIGSVAAKDVGEVDRDAQNFETSGSDSSTIRQKNSIDKMDNIEFPNSNERIKAVGVGSVQEDERVENVQGEEKHQRKRKRTIMNDVQVSLIEKALLDEPDMQRKAASLQTWADKLSLHGSEVSTSQLKNWLNNRKARLARAAAKDVRAPSVGDGALHDKQSGSESPNDDLYVPFTAQRIHQNEAGGSSLRTGSNENEGEFGRLEPGQHVLLVSRQGEEVGEGCVYQIKGAWSGGCLAEGMCLVDVTNLKVDKWTRLPYPSEATGTTFAQAENILGRKLVLWESSKLVPLQPR